MERLMTRPVTKTAIPLGMVGVLFYLAHTILGNLLWAEYDPITMDISSLTAVGAPNAVFLRVLGTVYGLCMLVFCTAMLMQAIREHHLFVRIGYAILLVMNAVSFFGYALFPLEGDKTVMTFQNMMHIIVTVIVVITTIASGFFLAAGYRKAERTRRLGNFVLVMAVLITVFGMLNPMNMALSWNILGLTERLVIYTLQVMVFTLSYVHAFRMEG